MSQRSKHFSPQLIIFLPGYEKISDIYFPCCVSLSNCITISDSLGVLFPSVLFAFIIIIIIIIIITAFIMRLLQTDVRKGAEQYKVAIKLRNAKTEKCT